MWLFNALTFLITIIISVIATPFILIIMLLMLIVHQECPVFVQQRIGKNGAHFTMYKIKSFYNGKPSFLGRIIRKTSMDETPQIWNILKGDMKWVGPRPLMDEDLAFYPKDVFILYTQMKPGLTGLFQINGRKNLSITERAVYDKEYFYTRSALNDARIILKTIPAVLSGKGAA